MTSLPRLMAGSALAGAAAGARSLTGLAVLSLTASPDAEAQPDRVLGRPWAKGLVSLLAAQECVLDKLPIAPSRLGAPGLAGRLTAAAVSAVVIVRRRPAGLLSLPGALNQDGPAATAADSPPPGPPARTSACVAVSVAAAAATAWLGAQWRAWAAPRLGRDWVAAVIEDAAALTIAATAVAVRGQPADQA